MEVLKKYNMKYDFGAWNSRISAYMNRILMSSTQYLMNQVRNDEVTNLAGKYSSMLGFLDNVEEYLAYSAKSSNFNSILSSIEKVKAISVLPDNMCGVYGYTDNGVILVNPNFNGNGMLTGKDRSRLYVAHELGHFVNSDWNKSALNYIESMVRSGKINVTDGELFFEGFNMLDEAITQNRAENFAYAFARKSRPAMQKYRNPRVFDGAIYETNFDYYGEFQKPAILFGRTLRGIGKLRNDNDVLNKLSERATNPNFFNRIVNEYYTDGQLNNLFPMIENMGIIKKAVYSTFGADDASNLRKSKDALDSVCHYANKLRDTRDVAGSEYGNG